MILVKAGAAVDSFIDQLVPLLEQGDIIIDGGNSEYQDTRYTLHVHSSSEYQDTSYTAAQSTRIPGTQQLRVPGHQVHSSSEYQDTRYTAAQSTRIPGTQQLRVPRYHEHHEFL